MFIRILLQHCLWVFALQIKFLIFIWFQLILPDIEFQLTESLCFGVVTSIRNKIIDFNYILKDEFHVSIFIVCDSNLNGRFKNILKDLWTVQCQQFLLG